MAQAYPNRPIRLVVPFGAGSTADVLARFIGKSVSESLGQPMVIENRPGAGGIIGAEVVAKSPPDGYTLCLGTVASHSISAAMSSNLPYNLLTDFEPVALLVNAPKIIVVHASVPATTLPEYLDFARRKGRSLYSSAGVGTTTHMMGELLKVRHKVPLEHVPYRAVGQAFTDMVAGQLDMMAYQVPGLLPHIQAGTVRPIAAATAQRIGLMPNLPSVAESLGDTDFDFSAWFGLFAPARTPPEIVRRIADAVTTAMASPELRQQLPAQGLEPLAWGPERFVPFFRAEAARWAEVVRLTGVTMN